MPVILHLTNDLSEVARLVAAVGGFCREHNVGETSCNAMNLALEEIITNIISYGYDNGAAHAIIVELSCNADVLTAVVQDEGRAFNPLDASDPDLEALVEERPIGGLGILLVKRLMDSVEYARRGGRNVMTLRKHRGQRS